MILKMHGNKPLITSKRKIETGYSLDTLEVTSDSYKSKSHESEYYQAIRKQKTIAKLKRLIDVCPKERIKNYWKTYHCNRVKFQDGSKLIGSLCRKRWCQHCSRIKTAELIQGYKEPLKQMQIVQEFYFVTLTAPTVQARQLNNELAKRYKAFTRIKDNIRKNYGLKLNGLRKTEITYNEHKDKYHPHFHLMVQGLKQAQLIQSLWLKQFPNASNKAQDIQLIDTSDSNNLVEVFKYATKDVTRDTITAKAMDNIYKALDGLRTIQTYGSIRKVKEPKEVNQDQIQVDWILPKQEIWIYNEHTADYHDYLDNTLIGTQELL
jgi:plasmid rolling circle replication initiator protein Rep